VHHLFPAIPHYRLREAHKILMQEVPEYAAGHHCDGFFFPRRPEAPSVLQDILRDA
jgi:fatty acid desaturase